MAICNFLAPNQEKSLLAIKLKQMYGIDEATTLWTFANANLDLFDKFDKNGEPLVLKVREAYRGINQMLSEENQLETDANVGKQREQAESRKKNEAIQKEKELRIVKERESREVADKAARVLAEKLVLTREEEKLERSLANVPEDIKPIIREIVGNKEFVKLTADEKNYYNSKTKTTYKRVTTFIGDGAPKETELLKSASIIGTKLDIFVRDFFDGNLQDLDTYDAASPEILESFKKQLQKVKEAFEERGEAIISNGVTLYNEALGVAGTVDLLSVDKDGVIRIYDMKTMRGNQLTSKYAGQSKVIYDSTQFGKSNRQKHTQQLSMYNILLNNTHGLRAQTLGIIPIEVQYEPGDTSTTKVELLKGIKITQLKSVSTATFTGNNESSKEPEEFVTPKDYYEGRITELGENEIFVFGSNLGSSTGGPPTHGAGSAKDARVLFGAIQGQPYGRQGQSYGIVTKKHWDVERSSTAEEIETEIRGLYLYAEDNPELRFMVAYKAGEKNRNGYTDVEMAGIFASSPIPSNIIFEKGFKALVDQALAEGADNETSLVLEKARLVNNSGGADGGDTAWDQIGREFGVTNHVHWREPLADRVAKLKAIGEAKGKEYPQDWMEKVSKNVDSKILTAKNIKATPVSDKDYEEGKIKATAAVAVLGRELSKENAEYQYRNWAQVKYADTVFAVGSILRKGSKTYKGKTLEVNQVAGGTGYAVQMAVAEGKRVYIYDEAYEAWFTITGGEFVEVQVPVLTKNFAGIGGREVGPKGEAAIRAVYQKTAEQFESTGNLAQADTKPQKMYHKQDGVPGAKARVISTRVIELATKKGGRQSVEVLENNLKALYTRANENPTKYYSVEGEFVSLKRVMDNGYMPDQFASIVAGLGPKPLNVIFSRGIQNVINHLPSSYAANYVRENQATRLTMNVHGNASDIQMNTLFIPVYNKNMEQEGNFTPEKQKGALDVAFKMVFDSMKKDPTMNPYAAFYNVMKNLKKRMNKHSGAKDAFTVAYVEDLRKVITSFAFDPAEGKNSVAAMVFNELYEYGVRVKDKDRILKALALDKMGLLEDGFKQDGISIEFTGEHTEENLGGKNTDEEGNDNFIGASGRMLENYSDMVFELDPMLTASWRMKWALGSLTAVQLDPKTGQVVPIKNYLGANTLAHFTDTYTKLLGLLVDQNPTYDNFLQILEDNVNTMPVLKEWIETLEKSDDSFKNEFVKVMNVHYSRRSFVTYKEVKLPDGRFIWVLNPFESNRGALVNQVIENWKQSQKLGSSMKVEGGEKKINTAKVVAQLVPRLTTIQNVFFPPTGMTAAEREAWEKTEAKILEALGYKADSFEEEIYKHAKQFISDAVSMGIGDSFDLEAAGYLMNNLKELTGGKVINVADMFGQTKNGAPTGIISIFVKRLAGLMGDGSVETSDASIAKSSTNNNPLYSELSSVRILARVKSYLDPNLTTPSSKSVEGKTIYDYILPTSLSIAFNNLAVGNPEEYAIVKANAKKVHMTKFNRLLKSGGLTEDSFISSIDGMRKQNDSQGITRGEMSDREQMLFSLAEFQNRGKTRANYISMTHSDKTTSPMFMNFPKLNVGTGMTPGDVSQEDLRAVLEVFQSEYLRIREHNGVIFNHDKYNIGKNYFYFLPELNQEIMLAKVASGELVGREPLTKADVETLWNPDGSIALDVNQKAKKVIARIAIDFIDSLTQRTLDTWNKAGLVDNDSLNIPMDHNYLKVIRERLGFLYTPQEGWWKHDKRVTKEQVHEETLRYAAKDYSLNYYLNNVAVSQLFYGDPAEALKGGEEQIKDGRIAPGEVSSVINKTMTEYNKRLAKDIAPGQGYQWEKPTVTTITLADVETSELYLGTKELIKAFEASPSTDAQELTTVEEDLTVRYASGVIPKKIYDEMMLIIKASESRPDRYYEFEKPEHLAIIMQPMKPVYAGLREIGTDGTRFYDYVKSSAYALYPPFTVKFKIDGLRIAMETKKISRAHFSSAKKLGGPAIAATAFDKNGNFDAAEFEKTSKGATQILSREGFRIQQEVPYDAVKEAVKTVTQMNKLITESIGIVTTPFRIEGLPDMSGKELRAYKEDLRKQMITHNLQEYLKDSGAKLNEDGTITVYNKQKILDKLISQALADDYNDNEIAALKYMTDSVLQSDGTVVEGQLQIPLWFSGDTGRIEKLMMSGIKKIAEIYMPGKSYVQASSVGYVLKENFRTEGDLTDAERNAIVFVDGYDASQPLRTMQRGEKGQPSIAAQVLAPFNFMIKNDIGEDVVADINDYLIPRTRRLDMTKVPKELLQLVGARIPNQGHNSMLPIEIVGFLPKSMGDLMIVPSAITTQMGADFDVDKLYTYKRAYIKTADGFAIDRFTGMKTRFGAKNAEEWIALKKEVNKRLDNPKGNFIPGNVFNKELSKVLKEKYPDGNIPSFSLEDSEATKTMRHLTNDYFDVHWSVLTHEEMYDRVLSPLDKKDLQTEQGLLIEPKESRNHFDINTQIELFQSGKYAKTLVAQTSLTSVFNSVIQVRDLRLGYMEAAENGDMIEKSSAVLVYDDNNQPISLSSLSGTGTSTFIDSKGVKYTRTKIDNISILQSAAVDNAKTNILNSLNLTPDTYRAVAALLLLESKDGRAVDLRYVTRLLKQRVIKDYSNKMATGNDGLSKKFVADLDGEVKRELLESLEKAVDQEAGAKAKLEGKEFKEEESKSAKDDFKISPESLLAEFENPTSKGQLAILNLFTTLSGYGKRISELQSLIHQDTNGAGQSLLTAIDKREKYNNLNSGSGILGEDTLFRDGNGVTEQGRLFDATVNTAIQVFGELLPYSKLTTAIARVRSVSMKPHTNVKLQQKIADSVRSYLISGTAGLWTGDVSAERFRLMYNIDGPSLGQRIMAAKQGWGLENILIKALEPKIEDIGDGPDLVEFNASKEDSKENSTMVVSFMQLLNSTNRDEKLLAEDLVRYAYATGGNATLRSFIKMIPVSFIADSMFAEGLRTLNIKKAAESVGWLTQFYQHEPTEAVQISKEIFEHAMKKGGTYPEMFTLNKAKTELNRLLKVVTMDGGSSNTDFVHYQVPEEGNKIILYRKRGEATYERIDTLGNGVIKEYNGKFNDGVRSIFQDNRSFMDNFTGPGVREKLDTQVEKLTKTDKVPGKHYRNWGLTDAGGREATVNFITENISTDKDIAVSLRSVADILLATKKNIDTRAIQLIHGEGSMPNAEIAVKFGTKKGAKGVYDSANNIIMLDEAIAENSTPSRAAETFLHELLHGRVSQILVLAGHLKLVNKATLNAETKKHYDSIVKNFRSENPQAAKIVDELDRIRYEARLQLKAAMGEYRFNELEAELEDRDITKTPDHILVYALSSITELVSHSMTNTKVMKMLNTMQDPNGKAKNWFDKIINLVARLIVSLRESLGIDVVEISLLHSAISNVAELLSLEKENNIDTNAAITDNASLVVQTESEALAIQHSLENSYNKQVTLVPGVTSIEIKVDQFMDYGVESAKVPDEIKRVIEALKKQSQELYFIKPRVGIKTAEARKLTQSINHKLDQIEQQIGDLTATADINVMKETGVKQLEWVETILRKPKVTSQEVMVATATVENWVNIVEIMYGKERNVSNVDPGIASIAVKAEQLKRGPLMLKARSTYIAMVRDNFGVDLTTENFTDLTDINWGSMQFLDLSRAQRGVISTAATFIKTAAANVSEDISRLGSKLDNLETTIKAAGYKTPKQQESLYRSFMQENKDGTAWGLLTKYSIDWTTDIQNMNFVLKSNLTKANGYEESKRKAARKAIYKSHWNKLRKIADFVDTRVFFDEETGERLTGPEVDAEYERIVKTMGPASHIEELLDKAYDKYQVYLTERRDSFTQIDEDTQLTADEKATITLSEAEQKGTISEQRKLRKAREKVLLADKMGDLKSAWESKYSPNNFFYTQFDNDNTQGFGSLTYAVMAPRLVQAKYYDKKYLELVDKPTEFGIYQEFMKIKDNLVALLPEHLKNRTGDNFLPSMEEEMINSMFSKLVRYKPANIRSTMLEAVTVSQWEKDNQKNETKIPIRYIDNTNIGSLSKEEKTERVEKLATQSVDLPRVLDVFGRMAYHYKHMSETLDTINMVESLLKETNRTRLANDEAPITNILTSFKYYKEAMLFQKSKKLEGVSETAIHSSSPKEHKKLQLELKALVEEKIALEDKFENGEDGLDRVEVKRLKQIDRRVAEIEGNSRYVVGSKIGDQIISFTQMKALAYNPFAAVTNLSFAFISTYTYASGREDFTNKDLRSAWKVLMHSWKNYVTFGRGGDNTSDKTKAFMTRANIISETSERQYGESNIAGRQKSTLTKAADLNNWQLGGDYFTKGLVMVAMLKNKMITYLDKEGIEQTISLWDAHDDNAVFDEKLYGKKPEWYSEDVSDQKEWNKFKLKIKMVHQLIHGNQDATSKMYAKQTILWRLLGQFKLSWLPEGIATRWAAESDTIDPILGRAVKGRYRSWSDLGFIPGALILARQVLSALPGNNIRAFEGVKYGKGPKIGQSISQVDIENMRRNLTGLAFTAAFLAAGLLLKLSLPDDEEKKRRRAAGLPTNPPGAYLLMNMLTRNYQDLTLYASTEVVGTVFGQVPVMSTVNDFIRLAKAHSLLMGDDPKKFEKYMQKVYKAFPLINNVNKWRYMVSDDISKFGR